MRFRIWRVRRASKVLSRYAASDVIAWVDNVRVGIYRRGEQIG